MALCNVPPPPSLARGSKRRLYLTTKQIRGKGRGKGGGRRWRRSKSDTRLSFVAIVSRPLFLSQSPRTTTLVDKPHHLDFRLCYVLALFSIAIMNNSFAILCHCSPPGDAHSC
ncbi:hypothetical protein LY76DRAFT_402902 [Colletotrichum caudatum]|nr:hypothetical protein LY76DRAFT_402902 [Colletotrichum caudatum]